MNKVRYGYVLGWRSMYRYYSLKISKRWGGGASGLLSPWRFLTAGYTSGVLYVSYILRFNPSQGPTIWRRSSYPGKKGSRPKRVTNVIVTPPLKQLADSPGWVKRYRLAKRTLPLE
jgi:hypothetical protein